MMISFSPPDMTEAEVNGAAEAIRSGWITTGSKTKEFERKIAEYVHTKKAVCLNSQTACAEMALRLLGIESGDEVIVPAYTYTASASVVCHVGATLVLADSQKDCVEMDYDAMEAAITEKTKAIIPVDLGGIPCDYNRIFEAVDRKRSLFKANNEIQAAIGRVAVCADSAHSFGASWHGKMIGEIADFSSYSFHAVKNLTTAEGGALVWNINGIDDEALYHQVQLYSLHGQSKDALEKTQLGAWEYDIIGPWNKCNMTDIMAGVGLAQLNRYPEILKRRKEIIGRYDAAFKTLGVEVLEHYGKDYQSTGHLYISRVPEISPEQRQEIIVKMAQAGISTNVHYKPLPMMTAYKNMGFDIKDFPNAYDYFANEITLPLHTKLTDQEVEYVIDNYCKIVKDYVYPSGHTVYNAAASAAQKDRRMKLNNTRQCFSIKTVTVVGANGTMGRNIAAIFASFGDASVYLVSRSMEKSIAAKNKAYQSVRAESVKERMIPSDYDHLEECIKKSDLIFEACTEDWGVKERIHKRIAQAVGGNGTGKVFCSGTSGLSITRLAELYPTQYRAQFMGMHMFNPPYQMTLCEMTSTKYTKTDRSVFDAVKDYVGRVLHRTVVETADSPAFLGNRIGFRLINEALQMAEEYKYNGGIDYIDSLIGPFTGRSMPPLVTANFVGLDVHKAIVENLYENTNDYSHDTYILPAFVRDLIGDGKIGRKAGIGLYKTLLHDSGAKIHQVYDIAHGYYREQMRYTFPFVEEMVTSLKVGDYEAAFHTLVENQSMEAKLCCEFLLKYIIYSLSAAKELGCDMSAADDVMATGFHWCPPLAMLDAFQSVTDFEQFCEERLNDRSKAVIREQHLLWNVGKSHYDYRKYVLAKR